MSTVTKYKYLVFKILFISLHVCYIGSNTNVLNLKDCKDPDFGEWQVQNAQYCKDKTPKSLHCQIDHTSGTIYSVCAVAVTCGKGTFAKLNTKGESVECTACSVDMYQPQHKNSNHFLQPNCDRIKRRCDVEDSKVLCENATPTQDYKCQCNKTIGYKPNMQGCDCFSSDEACDCYKVTCEAGKQLNDQLRCVPIPATRLTSPATTTVSVATSAVSAQSVGGPNSSVIVGSVVGVIIFVIVVIFIMLICRRKYSSKCKCPDAVENIPCFRIFMGMFATTDEVASLQNSSGPPHSIPSESDAEAERNGLNSDKKHGTPVTQYDDGKLAVGVTGGELLFQQAETKASEQKMKEKLAQKEPQTKNIGPVYNIESTHVLIGPHSQLNVVTQNTQSDESTYSEGENGPLLDRCYRECNDINLGTDSGQPDQTDDDKTDVKGHYRTKNEHTTMDSLEDTAIKQLFITHTAPPFKHGISGHDDTVDV